MQSSSTTHSQSKYQPALFWFGLAALTWVTFLLYAGGFTTSIRAGMAFLDWPLSNGSINPEGWLDNQDMMAEHSHRLLGAVMGLLSIGLCIAAFALSEEKRIRKLGILLVILVIAQGVLGGMRVMLDQLNLEIDHNLYAQVFAVAHATLAQLFLCLLVAFVISSSRSWIERNAGFPNPPMPGVVSAGWIACGTIVLQLIIGAVMRHSYAGLAIPTFPFCPPNQTLIPEAFDFAVAIHFSHRVGAVFVSAAILYFCVRIWRDKASKKALGLPSIGLILLLLVQGYLGALVIWTVRNPHVATIHMLNGAFTLALAWTMTFRSMKHLLDSQANQPSGHTPALEQGDDLKDAAEA